MATPEKKCKLLCVSCYNMKHDDCVDKKNCKCEY